MFLFWRYYHGISGKTLVYQDCLVCLKCDICELNKLMRHHKQQILNLVHWLPHVCFCFIINFSYMLSLFIVSFISLFVVSFISLFVVSFISLFVVSFNSFFVVSFFSFFVSSLKNLIFLFHHIIFYLILVCRDLFWLVASKEELTLNRLPRSLQKPSLNLEWILCKVCII